MKAEHRKELETNVLAHQFERVYEGLKQGPSRTTLFYVGAAALVVLVLVLFRYFTSSSESANSDRWTKLDEVVFPQQLERLLDESDMKNTPQGRLARFKEARFKLSEGMRDLGINRDVALKRVEEATEIYDELRRTRGRAPLLHQESLSGAARGNETLGELDKARDLYKQLADEYPATVLGKDAKKQLERLDDKNTQAELAELKKAFSATRGKRE
jgi:hypothetical protein